MMTHSLPSLLPCPDPITVLCCVKELDHAREAKSTLAAQISGASPRADEGGCIVRPALLQREASLFNCPGGAPSGAAGASFFVRQA